MEKRNEILKTLGRRVKLYRKRKGLSQEVLAEIVGCHWKTISMIECGKLNPSFLLLYKICNALDISIPELVPQNRNVLPYPEGEIADAVSEFIKDGSPEDIKMAVSILRYIQGLRKR